MRIEPSVPEMWVNAEVQCKVVMIWWRQRVAKETNPTAIRSQTAEIYSSVTAHNIT